MQHKIQPPHRPTSTSSLEVAESIQPPLKVTIVYEGQSGLARANELWFKLAARFDGEIQIATDTWNFALLRGPRLRELAARAAIAANIIIVSASGASPLPAHIRNWIDAWLPLKRGRNDAFAVLLEEKPADSNELVPELREAAEEEGHMEFFCNSPEVPFASGKGKDLGRFDTSLFERK